jgi:pimeloyl-ACP methyl ester carboxylesterase
MARSWLCPQDDCRELDFVVITVVVPDRRGMGLSSHPADGYDKRTQAADVRAVRTPLGRERAVIVEHDLGPMVAYAYAARSPDTTSSRRQ